MSVKWILIIAMFRGGMLSVEFDTFNGCDAARAQTVESFQNKNAYGKNLGSYVDAICVEKK